MNIWKSFVYVMIMMLLHLKRNVKEDTREEDAAPTDFIIINNVAVIVRNEDVAIPNDSQLWWQKLKTNYYKCENKLCITPVSSSAISKEIAVKATTESDKTCFSCIESNFQLGIERCEPCACRQDVRLKLLECGKNRVVSRDGCNCCLICARLYEEKCDRRLLCDASKGYYCVLDENDRLPPTIGICRQPITRPCVYNGLTVLEGTAFRPDCRNRCSCINTTLVCEDLCWMEKINPLTSDMCSRPRLITIEGECCKYWTCDTLSGRPYVPEDCQPEGTDWSICSTYCGVGISFRMSNQNEDCILRNMSRLCQIRPCSEDQSLRNLIRSESLDQYNVVTSSKVQGHLLYRSCISTNQFNVTYCRTYSRTPNCCLPVTTKTVTVNFVCRQKVSNDYGILTDTTLDMTSSFDLENSRQMINARHFYVGLQVMQFRECFCSPNYCIHPSTEIGYLRYLEGSTIANLTSKLRDTKDTPINNGPKKIQTFLMKIQFNGIWKNIFKKHE